MGTSYSLPSKLAFLFLFSFSLLVVSSTSSANEETSDAIPSAPPSELYPEGLLQMSANSYFSPYAFVVDKSLRTLYVWKASDTGLELVSTYATDLGKRNGAKKARGDHRTPEGIYFLQEMKQGPELNFEEYGERAFTTDYPNFFDRRAGKTGDGIWLHAVPDKKSLQRGSRGCVVVRNDVIKKLTDFFVPTKTPLLIYDKVQYKPLPELKKSAGQVQKWLESWGNAWQSKDIDKYMSFYSEQFRSLDMNKEKWRAYKMRLNEVYSSISVAVEDPRFLVHKDEWIIKFLQRYRSDKVSDYGEKTLFIRSAEGQLLIEGEEWRAVDQKQMAMSAGSK